MPAPAGHPRYGGRAKGTPNKRTQEFEAALRSAGYRGDQTEDHPGMFLWLVMTARKQFPQRVPVSKTNPDGSVEHGYFKVMEPAPLDVRLNCARELTPYLLPRLKNVEVTGADGEPITYQLLDGRTVGLGTAPATGKPKGGGSSTHKTAARP